MFWELFFIFFKGTFKSQTSITHYQLEYIKTNKALKQSNIFVHMVPFEIYIFLFGNMAWNLYGHTMYLTGS